MDTKDVMAALTRLVMRNIIAEAPGGFFIRTQEKSPDLTQDSR